MTFKTTHELLLDEQHYKASLRRLEEAEPLWRPKYADTAARTIANIKRQLEHIQGELQMVKR